MWNIFLGANAEETIQNLTEGMEEVRRNMKFQVFRALTVIEKQVKANINANFTRRTGALVNSWDKTVTDSGNSIEGTLESKNVPYARIHEFGGTIVPKNAKALAIPAPENRRRDGSPKMTLSEVFNGTNNAFVTKGGAVMLASGKGANAKLTPMFFFKQSVTIPARPYVRPALAATKEKIQKDFGLFIAAAFGKKE